MNKRPALKIRPYKWHAKDGKPTAGIGMFQGDSIKAHLTPAEARAMADKLHDMADELEAPQRPTPGP